MIAVDTNVLVRVIAFDDAEQAQVAQRILQAGAYVSATVLMEAAWVLARSYKIDRPSLAEAFEGLLDMPAVRIADEPLIRWVLSRYRAGADMADMIHLTQSARAEAFATFDRKLARLAGSDAPIMIETLA